MTISRHAAVRLIAVALALALYGSAGAQVSAPPEAQATKAAASASAPANGSTAVGLANLVRAAAQDGRISYKQSEPEELIELLGEPTRERKDRDGDYALRVLVWPDIEATFIRPRELGGPFTLARLTVGATAGGDGEAAELDIGQNRPMVLRSVRSLASVDRFFGLAGASLVRLDLREEAKRLRALNFDTRTVWPPAAQMPAEFDPQQVLEEGKNPGLGVRALHAQGIDGRGVHVAIIDQPLLLDHREYAGHIERYELIDTYDVGAQMHGPPVTSILIGRSVGVAPAARLSFFAVPTWKSDNAPLAEALERILTRNEQVPVGERVRVVSISTGMFPQWPNLERWRAAAERAEQTGVLVLTCEMRPDFAYGTRNREGPPDDPASYRRGRFMGDGAALGVPAGGRTNASHAGPDVYTYWAEGGMSWCTPYLAGVATLGVQVDPNLTPARARELLKETASKTKTGLLVNPPGFIEAVRAGVK